MKYLLSFLGLICLFSFLLYSCGDICVDCMTADGTQTITICESHYESKEFFDGVVDAWEDMHNVACVVK